MEGFCGTGLFRPIASRYICAAMGLLPPACNAVDSKENRSGRAFEVAKAKFVRSPEINCDSSLLSFRSWQKGTEMIRQRMVKTAVFVTLMALGLTLSAARVAHAEPTWVLADGGGCATAISVGANDIPWVIGCGAPAVFYLANVRSCTGSNLCVATTKWVDANKPGALNIATNLNGKTFITDTAGELWLEGYEVNTLGPPNVWIPLPTSFAGSPACIQSFAVSSGTQNPVEMIEFENSVNFSGTFDHLWGVGCGGNPNAPLFTIGPLIQPIHDDPSIYFALPVWNQYGGPADAASQMALFTEPGPNIDQVPWVVANGRLYVNRDGAFSVIPTVIGGGSRFLSVLRVKYLTDHYILANDGNVYRWHGNAHGWDGNTFGGDATSWILVAGPTPNAPIKQIAWSQALPNTARGTIGPSRLWAIDTNGAIYTLQDTIVVK